MQADAIRASINLSATFAFYMAFLMLLPALADLVEGHENWKLFVVSAGITASAALVLAAATRAPPPPLSPRFAFIVVNMLWLTFSAVASLPFLLSSLDITVADAVFEAVSGVTATGSTVLSGLDAMPAGILLWRSILQWLGGLGVIALGLFLLPFLNISGFSLFKVESSERADKPFARVRTFAISLIGIYLSFTLACSLLYAASGMTGFDAVNHAMTTISTAGYSTHDSSLAGYGADTLWVAILFMLLGALPFSFYILVVSRRQLAGSGFFQVRVFLAYTALPAAVLTVYLSATQQMDLPTAFTHATFNIVSVVTTTGYASDNYLAWGPIAVAIFFLCTFLGGCSTSTTGGIKAYRFIILFGMLRRGLHGFIYPNMVQPLRSGDQIIPEAMQQAVVLFIGAFLLSWFAGTILLGALGLDLVTAMSGALTALANVGPGLGHPIGPDGNFSSLPDGAKWILAFLMLLGRLEILTVLVLLSPVFWRS